MKRKLFVLFAFISLLFLCGCLTKGDLRIIPEPPIETFAISGKIVILEPIETDLLSSIRKPLADATIVKDYSKFQIIADSVTKNADKDGSFSLTKIQASDTLVLKAVNGKIVLKRRIYPTEFKFKSLNNLTIDINTTAKALIWEKAKADGVELTESDISAREYTHLIASITQAIRLAMLMPKKDVPKTILDLEMVARPVAIAAKTIIPRENSVKEACAVLYHALLREDLEIIKHYISTDFSNDWDTSSNYKDFVSQIEDYFKRYIMKAASYTILQMEFVPGNLVRVRTAMQASYTEYYSGLDGNTPLYTSDIWWRKEGNFWKIHRNFPYKFSHPTQVDADAKWGEIANVHKELHKALAEENIEVFRNRISLNFTNDWDSTSTYSDLLDTTRNRFNAYDIKVSSYTIHSIDFFTNDHAKVRCSAQVKVINVSTGYDVDSGVINATIEWRKENNVWKIWKNLPYRFTHPRNILKSIIANCLK